MIRRLAPVALFLLVCGVRPAAAFTCNTFQVNNFNFVNYVGATIQGTANITVNCPNGTAYSVGLNAGVYGGSVTSREMNGGTGNAYYLGYEIFSNASYTTNWGNTSGSWVTGTGTGNNQTLTEYFEIPGGEYAGTGGYQDTIIATLTAGGSSTTGQFNINGTVQPFCAISASNLNFGNYSGTLVNASSTLTIGCTLNDQYTVGLSAGTSSGATVTNRAMTGPGGALLKYQLYSNSGHSTYWGNTTNTVAGTGTGFNQSLTVYGQMPAGQNVAPGSYTDTIIATLTY